MTQYAIFRGDKVVGREIFHDIKQAIKEKDEWNEQFARYNDKIKTMPQLKGSKPISFVEVKEYRKKRQTREQKLREAMGGW